MKKLIILFILFTSMTFAQKIEIGNEENQMKTYKYVLENFDFIKKNNPEELIYVELSFNKYSFLEKVTYYSSTTENRNDEHKTEIQILNELDEFIKNSFSFFNKDIFFSKRQAGGVYSFFIPLNKENLKIAIKNIRNGILNEKSEIDKIGIITNSKFNLQIDNLYFNSKKNESIKIESQLNGLNSELIEIAPNLYLVFRIIKTNQFITNKAIDYFEYKIMYLEGNSSELLIIR